MVTIVDYHVRTSTKDGKEFIALELQGDFELVQSEQTGRFYATAKRCSVSSTFNEDTAKCKRTYNPVSLKLEDWFFDRLVFQ